MKKRKVIPIIIVTYNQLYEFTIPCIDSILKNSHNLNFKIIVVDNCSSDGTVQKLEKRYPSNLLTVIETGSNLGWNGGNIKGIEFIDSNLNYELFVLLNSDTIVSPGWLDRMVKILTGNKNAVSIIPVEKLQQQNLFKKFYNNISDNMFIKFCVNYTPIRLLKGKKLTQTRVDRPELDSISGGINMSKIELINSRLMKKYGETFEYLPSLGSGYCVLLKKTFRDDILFFLENFETIFPNEKYWIDIKGRENIDYLHALGVYVYHFRGGSGGY